MGKRRGYPSLALALLIVGFMLTAAAALWEHNTARTWMLIGVSIVLAIGVGFHVAANYERRISRIYADHKRDWQRLRERIEHR